MKQNFLTLLALLMLCSAQAQSNFGFDFISRWDNDSLAVASPGNLNLQYSGSWAMAVDGREIVVVGGAANILFFDVTNPETPVLKADFPGTWTTVWREFRSYKNRIYAVSDNTNEGMMIFDLTHAADSIVRTYWSTEFFDKAHSITLDTVSGHIYLNGGNAGQGIIVLDASQNPDKPTFLGHPDIPGGYVHDSYVRGDTLYCSSGYDGYYVLDFRNATAPTLISSISTGGYNHNSWLTLDGKYAYYTEEVPRGLPIHCVDLTDLTTTGDMEIALAFLDNLQAPNDSVKLAISHNVYIKNNLLFNSQYEDGLLVYDISVPTSPVLKAHYDTHPQNTAYNGYFGNWGNYPWLPSGTIVACDMQNGMYLLRLNPNVGTRQPDNIFGVEIYPNPANDLLQIKFHEQNNQDGAYRLFNMSGQMVQEGVIAGGGTKVNMMPLQSGMYFIEITNYAGQKTLKKVVKQ